LALVVFLAASAVVLGSHAEAQEEEAQAQPDDEAARAAFRQGQAHYERGEFAQAAEEFEEAYRLSHRARLLYNAYLAYRDMQELPGAARALSRFLEQTSDLTPEEREQLEARLTAMRRAMEQGRARTDGAGAEESDEPAGDTSAPDAATTATAATPTEPSPSRQAGGDGFSPSPVAFVVGGAGVALGVAALVTGLLSSSDLSKLHDNCPGGMCPNDPSLHHAQSEGQALAYATDALWITGVVALGTGVALLFVPQDDEDEGPSAGMACAPSGCFGTLSGRF